MHPKSFVFSRSSLLVAAALGCGVPAVSAQVVIHPDWIVAYAFPSISGMTSAEPTSELPADFASPVFVADSCAAFATGVQLAAPALAPETPCREAGGFADLSVCFAPCASVDLLFSED